MNRSPQEIDVGKEADKVGRHQERQLIVAACSGDRRAIRTLVELHKDRLFAFIWRMVRNHHDAEDVCQEAFLKAFASLDTFSSEYRFSTWLFTIGYRVCLNRLRRKRTNSSEIDVARLPIGTAPVDSGAAVSEEADRLQRVVWSGVEQLIPPQQATLVLFYRNELGCQEIARILEVPVATVKSHLHRGRAKLREVLESMDDAEIHAYRSRVG
jgi:RNA polymerase sigma-70 factor (ECF subfamily)